MSLWNKNELIEALGEDLIKQELSNELMINEVIIDGRKSSKNSLFIALKGDNHNGHHYLEQAKASGASVFLIDDKEFAPKSNYLLVKNSYDALINLAKFARNRSKANIAAITGSVGKTTVKEMVKEALLIQWRTFANAGNFNNHIGLPLSLCNLPKDCEFAIFEMGMNHAGEIEFLSKLTRPHLAVITNIGDAHIGFFKNEEEIAAAKAEIFMGLEEDGTGLVDYLSPHYEFLKRKFFEYTKDSYLFSFGTEKRESDNDGVSFPIIEQKIIEANKSEIEILQPNYQKIRYTLGSSSESNIVNSLIAMATLRLMYQTLPKLIEPFEKFQEKKGRGLVYEHSVGGKNITIIDDSYNASSLSMKSGIDRALQLAKLLKKKRVVLALGEMLEMGNAALEKHKEIISYACDKGFDLLIAVGENMIEATKSNDSNKKIITFHNSSDAADAILDLLTDQDLLYIKGSRGVKMEKILEKLQ